MGKSSTPAAPDYSSIASADAESSQLEYNLGEQEFQFGQQQFATEWPYAQQYLQAETNATNAEQASAQQQQQVYSSTFLPMEQQFAQTAQNYDSPDQAQQQAGSAMADVSNTYEQQRNSSLSQLESYGIDPSQTRFGALDLSSRVSQAAATAAAGTQSNLNTQATGLALQGEAINMGMGFPNSVAESYNTATSAGQAGLSGANSTTSTAANVMSSAEGYYGLGNSALNNETSALNTGFEDELGSDTLGMQETANTMSGIGSLAGMGLAAMML